MYLGFFKMKIIKISQLLFVILLISSCKTIIDKNQPLNDSDKNNLGKPDKSQMEVRFSCGDNGIENFIDEGWIIVEEFSQEKVCTWKSVPATKKCNMDKDKGCKITIPDKVGEEKIYILER